MSNWRNGKVDRTLLGPAARYFAPVEAFTRLTDISLEELKQNGKRLILLDVDHTLVPWKAEEFAIGVPEWVTQAKEMGFELCILSNTRHPERLMRLSKALGIEALRGRFKPSRKMYLAALSKFGRKPEEAIMIGDQMMTDILGANRTGIEAIWVCKMDGPEFAGTKINRAIERRIAAVVYNALVSDGEQGAPKSKTLQQLIRFVVVGGLSFIIDAGLTTLLMNYIHVGDQPLGHVLGHSLRESAPFIFQFATKDDSAAAPILGGLASFVAMFNSFILNRMWTFEATESSNVKKQVIRFYSVAIFGALLNTLIFSVFYSVLPLGSKHKTLLSKAVAAAIVAVWNFLGQRHFAFREHSK